jgi:hypothetical protein
MSQHFFRRIDVCECQGALRRGGGDRMKDDTRSNGTKSPTPTDKPDPRSERPGKADPPAAPPAPRRRSVRH